MPPSHRHHYGESAHAPAKASTCRAPDAHRNYRRVRDQPCWHQSEWQSIAEINRVEKRSRGPLSLTGEASRRRQGMGIDVPLCTT
ncbi:unnamed protein product, partial [Iphiclides podalirius]